MTIDEAIKHCKDVAIEKREEAEETYRAFCLYSLNAEAESTFVDECEECEKCAEQHEQLAEWLEELKEYKELEEQEMLIKLPCKIGDTVYIIGCKYRHGIQEKWINTGKFEYSDLEKLNKTVFLTKEAAEEALKRIGDGGVNE